MKKMFFFSLAALLWTGCFASDFQGKAGEPVSAQATSGYYQIEFQNYVDSNLDNQSYVEYIDEYGNRQTLYPTGLSSYINVAKDGYLIIHAFVIYQSGGEMLNGSVSTSGGFSQDISGPNPITAEVFVGDLSDHMSVTLQASLQQ